MLVLAHQQVEGGAVPALHAGDEILVQRLRHVVLGHCAPVLVGEPGRVRAL